MRALILILFLTPLFTFSQTDKKMMTKKGIDLTKHIPKGLKVGDKAPIIKGVSITGETINSDEISKSQEVVVIFYRGEWCPVCNRYLGNLNDSLQYILNKNAKVIVVGPENFKNTEETADKSKATFTLLPDTTSKILKDYDVLFYVTEKYQKKIKLFLKTDIAMSNNQNEAQLPVPATFIIGKDGLVKWRHFNYDYTKRATVKEIIDNLK